MKNKTVFIVIEDYYESWIYGVFSSMEIAKHFIKNHDNNKRMIAHEWTIDEEGIKS